MQRFEVRVRVLGELGVTRSDGTVVDIREWRTGKNMDLLRLLALAGDGSVRTATILDRLWPDVSEDRGRSSLRTAASQIRRVVGSNVIQRRPDALQLVGAWVDVTEFLACARSAHQAHLAGDRTGVLRLADMGTALHRGEFTAYDDDSPWVQAERDLIAQARHELLCEAAEAALDLGHFHDARAFASTAVQVDPISEQAHRLLMRAHAELGEIGSALRVFEHYRSRLASELGVDPSRQTRELHLRLLSDPDA